MKNTRLLSLLSFLFVPVAASSWVPSDCSPGHEKGLGDFRRLVEQAKRGSTLYTPKPYPRNSPAVIEDFEAAYLDIWKTTPETEVPEEERVLSALVRTRQARYQVVRVEDWTTRRCSPLRGSRFRYLLLIADPNGNVIARGAINESGLFAGYQVIPPGASAERIELWRSRVPADPGLSVQRWRSSLGQLPAEAQYVELDGTLRCSFMEPCVTFRVGARAFVDKHGELFELDFERPSFRDAEITGPASERRREILASPLLGGSYLVSVGFDRWMVLRPSGQAGESSAGPR